MSVFTGSPASTGDDLWRCSSVRRARPSSHQHVPELPGVGSVDVFREQAGPVAERGPVGVIAFDGPKIRPLDFQAAAEIHLISLDDPGGGIFQRPYHAGENRR